MSEATAVEVAADAAPALEASPIEKMESRIAELAAEEGVEAETSDAKADAKAEPDAKKLTPEQEESERLTKGQKFLAKTHAQRQRLKAEREEYLANKRAFDAQVGGFSEKLKSADAFDRIRSLAESDPIAALEELGIDYTDVTRRVLAKGTPEEAASQAVKSVKSEALAEIEKLKAELREEKANAQASAAMSTLLGSIQPASTPEAATLLKAEGAEHLRDIAIQIDSELLKRRIQFGEEYSLADITNYLEQHAKVVNARRREAYGLAPGAETGLGQRANPSGPRAPARTLTNRQAAETSRGTDDLSDEDREREAASILRTLSRR